MKSTTMTTTCVQKKRAKKSACAREWALICSRLTRILFSLFIGCFSVLTAVGSTDTQTPKKKSIKFVIISWSHKLHSTESMRHHFRFDKRENSMTSDNNSDVKWWRRRWRRQLRTAINRSLFYQIDFDTFVIFVKSFYWFEWWRHQTEVNNRFFSFRFEKKCICANAEWINRVIASVNNTLEFHIVNGTSFIHTTCLGNLKVEMVENLRNETKSNWVECFRFLLVSKTGNGIKKETEKWRRKKK